MLLRERVRVQEYSGGLGKRLLTCVGCLQASETAASLSAARCVCVRVRARTLSCACARVRAQACARAIRRAPARAHACLCEVILWSAVTSQHGGCAAVPAKYVFAPREARKKWLRGRGRDDQSRAGRTIIRRESDVLRFTIVYICRKGGCSSDGGTSPNV